MGEDQKRDERFIRDEQSHLWTELGYAISSAINGVWSINAAGIAHRIIRAARLVGPTPYGNVQWPLLAGDVYEAVLRAGELPLDLPDEPEWRRLDDLMGKYGPPIAVADAIRGDGSCDQRRRWMARTRGSRR